jgi:N-acetyltransferase 10
LVAGSFGLTLHDMARLDRYAAGRADYRLVADLTPRLADFFFRGGFDDSTLSLAPSQEGALAALGLQRKTMAEFAADAGLEVPQATALFGKTMRRLAKTLSALMEERAGAASGVEEEAKIAAAVAETLAPVAGRLDVELADEAASLSAKERRRRQASANELLGRSFEVTDEAGAELARVAASAAAAGDAVPETVSVAAVEAKRHAAGKHGKKSSKKSKKRGRD